MIFFTSSKARASIWRTRSRDTPNSLASSASVIGSSARRRPSKIRRARGLSASSATDSARRRLSNSSLAAKVSSWSGESLTSQSCHSVESAIHANDILLGDAEPLGDELDLIRAHVAVIQRGNPALGLAQVEKQFAVVGRGADLHQRP